MNGQFAFSFEFVPCCTNTSFFTSLDNKIHGKIQGNRQEWQNIQSFPPIHLSSKPSKNYCSGGWRKYVRAIYCLPLFDYSTWQDRRCPRTFLLGTEWCSKTRSAISQADMKNHPKKPGDASFVQMSVWVLMYSHWVLSFLKRFSSERKWGEFSSPGCQSANPWSHLVLAL